MKLKWLKFSHFECDLHQKINHFQGTWTKDCLLYFLQRSIIRFGDMFLTKMTTHRQTHTQPEYIVSGRSTTGD